MSDLERLARTRKFFDFGRAVNSYRRLTLQTGLKLYGLDAVVTRAQDHDDQYREVLVVPERGWPEDEGKPMVQNFTCRILMDKPLEGLDIGGDAISLTDKVSAFFSITTDAALVVDDLLMVTYPDGKKIRLRVINQDVHHPLTMVGNKFTCVVY